MITTASDVGNAQNSRSPSALTEEEAPVDFAFFRIAPLGWTSVVHRARPDVRSKAWTDWLPTASSQLVR